MAKELVPDTWILTAIGEIADTTSGGTPLRSHSEYYDGNIPWVKSGELNDSLINDTEEHITENGLKNSSAKLFPKGTTLVALYGATVGKTGILGLDASTNQAVCALFPKSGSFTSKYMLYWLQSQRQNLIDLSVGGAQPNISQRIINQFHFPLAPIAEQERIVEQIEKHLTRLEAAVAALERGQKNLERYKASVLKAACEGRLVPQDPDDEPAEKLLERILAERRRKWEEQEREKQIERAKKKAAQAKRKQAGKPARIQDLAPGEWEELPEEVYGKYLPKNGKWKEKYQEPERPDTSGLPELPAGWVWATLNALCEVVSGFAFKSKDFQDYGIPVIKIANISYGEFVWIQQEYLSDEFLNKYPDYKVKSGSLLLALTRPITNNQVKVCLYPRDATTGLLNQRVAMILPSNNITKEYLLVLLQTEYFKNQISQNMSETLQPNLSPIELKAIPIPLPPVNEQVRIVEEIELKISIVLACTESIRRDRARSQILRQAILKKAFLGRLVPQDPSDESANVLLERIQAEKGERKVKKTGEAQQNEQMRLL